MKAPQGGAPTSDRALPRRDPVNYACVVQPTMLACKLGCQHANVMASAAQAPSHADFASLPAAGCLLHLNFPLPVAVS